MRYCLLFLSSIFLTSLYGQNLVPNGGFENFNNCPTDISQLSEVVSWLNPSNTPNYSTPDYFNSCSVTSCSSDVPNNRFGSNILSHSGNGYVGFLGYYSSIVSGQPNVREYIMVQLLAPLTNGMSYKLEFFVRRTNACHYATQIGAHLSSTPVIQSGRSALNFVPNVIESSTITDLNWVKISSTFISNGTEQYLIIGNFRNDSDTLLLQPGYSSDPCGTLFTNYAAYYYVDDVSIEMDVLSSDNFNKSNVVVFPNPSSDFLNVQVSSDFVDSPFTIFNQLGQEVYSGKIQEINTILYLKEFLVPGHYILMIQNIENKLFMRKPLIIL